MTDEPSTAETSPSLRLSDEHPLRAAAVSWLLSRINYERVADVPYNERQLKLDRMRQLLTRLGQPDAGLKIVHVAGTKGKGSTSAMIAGILTAAGYRTGLFTSPHLERIEERFAVDGKPCTSAELVALVERVRPVILAMDAEANGAASLRDSGPTASERLPYDDTPTFFEIVTAIALLHFVERQVDAAVLEVGLGGRLDSTNVCLPAVSVITSISFDHTKQLGNTLAAIAGEKAGIIKRGVPVVCGVTDAEPQAAIAEVAREHGCRLIQLGREFVYEYFGFRISDCGLELFQSEIRNPQSAIRTIDFNYHVPGREFALTALPLAMLGRHQAANAAIAVATVAELRHQGWCISTAAIRDGLGNTKMPGRVEVIPGEPLVVLDVAHNPASARALIDALAELPAASRRTLILSISRDKDVRAIAAELSPHFDRIIATQFRENPRAIAADELAEIIRSVLATSDVVDSSGSNTGIASGIVSAGKSSYSPREINVCAIPSDAWKHACITARSGELVCIAGSLFLTAELRPIVCGR